MAIAAASDLSIGASFFHLAETAGSPTALSPMGLAIMVVSIGAILTLLVWCYAKLLFDRTRQGEED